jgi:ATP-dependent exoDNAse (exonuclease V) beta subunit
LRIAELFAEQGPQSWSTQRVQDLQPTMCRWLVQQGHGLAEATQGATKVATLLCTTLASEQGNWVLQTHDGAACEMALATVDSGNVVTHVIDRTFIDDGVRWIIDYKSTDLAIRTLDSAIEQQAESHRPQLERYASVFRDEGLPIRMAVFFMALGRLVELD